MSLWGKLCFDPGTYFKMYGPNLNVLGVDQRFSCQTFETFRGLLTVQDINIGGPWRVTFDCGYGMIWQRQRPLVLGCMLGSKIWHYTIVTNHCLIFNLVWWFQPQLIISKFLFPRGFFSTGQISFTPGTELRSCPASLATGQGAAHAGGAQTGRLGRRGRGERMKNGNAPTDTPKKRHTETTRNHWFHAETCELPMVWDVPCIKLPWWFQPFSCSFEKVTTQIDFLSVPSSPIWTACWLLSSSSFNGWIQWDAFIKKNNNHKMS